MSGSDDLSGEDPHLAQIAEEFERHSNELYERIADYMDEAEIGEAYVAQLLLEAMIRMRMEAYAIDVEKPSVAGLKLVSTGCSAKWTSSCARRKRAPRTTSGRSRRNGPRSIVRMGAQVGRREDG